jgi:hypothetical protein
MRLHALDQRMTLSTVVGGENGHQDLASRHADRLLERALSRRHEAAGRMTAMTHIAIQESLNGRNVDWMEKVSDDQYRK